MFSVRQNPRLRVDNFNLVQIGVIIFTGLYSMSRPMQDHKAKKLRNIPYQKA